MIQIGELRIGNFVWEDYSGDMQISLIDVDNGSIDLRKNISLPSGRYIIEDIEPIILTEEWLIKLPEKIIYPDWIKRVHDLQNWYYYNHNKKELLFNH